MYFCADVDEAAAGGAEFVTKLMNPGKRQNHAKLDFERRHREVSEEYGETLKTDPMSVIRAAEQNELMAFSAILNNTAKLPANLFPEVFRLCCDYADPKKLEVAFFSKKGPVDRSGFPDLSAKSSSPEMVVRFVWTAVRILGTPELRRAMEKQEDSFKELAIKNWQRIFSVLQFFYKQHSEKRLGMPKSTLGLSAALCEVLITLFSCEAVCEHVKEPADVFKFAWTLWLYGGPPKYGVEEDNYHNSPPSGCLATLHFKYSGKYSMLDAALEVGPAFGGIPTIADIALRAFHGCTGAWNTAVDMRYHFVVFAAFFVTQESRPRIYNDFMRALYASDGILKMIEGLNNMATQSRAIFRKTDLSKMMEIYVLILRHLMADNHRNVEQAARCGILDLLLSLDADRGDLPQSVVISVREILDIIPRYFVYHSVIGSYADEMRKLVGGSEPKDKSLTDGPCAEQWRTMKRILIERYCMKRFYDIVIVPGLKARYCNSCGKSEKDVPFRTCSACKLVVYCSKQCQTSDWKEDGHRQECKQGSDRYNTDIPFLCFLANSYVATRYKALRKKLPSDFTPGNAVFRVRFTTESNGPVMDVLPAHIADHDLSTRLSATHPHGGEVTAKNSLIVPATCISAVKNLDEANLPGPQIQVEVFESVHTMVNRHIAFDPDRRVTARTDAAKSLRTGHELRAGINAIDPRMVTLEGTDVVDDILSSLYVPGEDPWAYSCRDSESGSRRTNFLNAVDDYIKRTLKDEPTEDALSRLRIS